MQNVTAADDNGKGVYSCWGFFKAFCKGKGEVEEKKIAGAAGFKCKGHFVGVKVWAAPATCCLEFMPVKCYRLDFVIGVIVAGAYHTQGFYGEDDVDALHVPNLCRGCLSAAYAVHSQEPRHGA